MQLGTGVLLLAVGAILRFAVSVHTSGFNLHTIGLILIIVGAVGIILSLLFWSSWTGLGRSSTTGYRRERRVSSDGAGGYIEEERGA